MTDGIDALEAMVERLTAENARLTEDNKRIGELGRICIRQDQTIADMTAENARLRGELAAEEEANRLAAHDVQDAYERECARLRGEVERMTDDNKRIGELGRISIKLCRERDEWQRAAQSQQRAGDALAADLARVTGERDALLAAARRMLKAEKVLWTLVDARPRSPMSSANCGMADDAISESARAEELLRAAVAACAPPASGEVKP